MAYTPHTWQANELVTPEKLNAIEIGLGNTISNSGDNVISGSLKVTGLRTIQGNNASSAQLLFNDKNDSQLAEILVSENAHQMFFRIYATDHQNGSSDGKYRQYFFETTPTGLSSQETLKILSAKNVVDNLTSTSTSDVLSANMGKTLNDSKLNLSGGTLTGSLTLGNNTLIFKNGDRRTGLILNSSGQFHIYSYPSDNTDANTTNREWYYLPAPTAGRTSQGQYSILTSKTPVTVDQGGTGADTAAAARTNLGITPVNIGALATSGGTMSGGLTTAQLDTTGDVYFHPNNGTTTYLRFSRNNLTSNIMVRLAATTGGQFTIREYPTNNTSENDNISELYYLPTPDANLTSHKQYLILTTRSLITVGQGGTGVSTVSPNNVFAGPSTGTASGAPSFRQIVSNDIASLDAGKITTGTLSVARGGTGKSSITKNSLLFGNDTSALQTLSAPTNAGLFLKSKANALPSWASLTSSDISDFEIGETEIAAGSASSPAKVTIPNGRGIIIISRSTAKMAIAHIAKSSQNVAITGELPTGVTIDKESNSALIITNTYNSDARITWILKV